MKLSINISRNLFQSLFDAGFVIRKLKKRKKKKNDRKTLNETNEMNNDNHNMQANIDSIAQTVFNIEQIKPLQRECIENLLLETKQSNILLVAQPALENHYVIHYQL